MQIWIDGDACPRVIKDLLFRAAIRTQTPLMLVANHLVSIPPSPFIKRWQVNSGFDVVDQYIVDNVQPGDLVITADIPFADAVITAGGVALNPRGEFYSTSNIKQHLAVRNLNESLRSCQVMSGGPDKFSSKEIQSFANKLDTFLAKIPLKKINPEAL
jgi:uncharacterized protein YaiI (UPF0178 family)